MARPPNRCQHEGCGDTTSAVPPGCPLTPGEFECARLIAEGLTAREIATRRGVLVSTVRTLLNNAYRKVDVAGFGGAPRLVRVMVASGWLDLIDTDWEDFRLTAAQSLYLAAFVRWLHDPSEENTDERAFWLRGIFHEARITPPWEQLGVPRRGNRAGFIFPV